KDSRFASNQTGKPIHHCISSRMAPSWRQLGGRSSAPRSLPPLRQELEQPDFGGGQPFPRRWAFNSGQRVARTLLGRLDQRRMDIGFAADRDGIAEGFGDWLDHGVDADLL